MNDHEIVKQFVLSGEEPKQQGPEGQLRLDVISELLTGSVEHSANNWKNFSVTLTILEFKKKLEMFAGTAPQYQKLEIYDKENRLIAELNDDSKTLSDYPMENGMKVFVKDSDPNNTVKGLTDASNVEKYTISDESYNSREGTYKKWKEQNPEVKKATNDYSAAPENIKIGDRCEVEPMGGGDLQRRGTVMYVGPVEGTNGFWVGVMLDEPLGKNDGSVKGKRYFDCPNKYGSFVRPDKLTVGQFPVLDIDDEI